MDQDYTPIISAEERAARRQQRAESRRRKQRARRMRQLRRLLPCLLLVVLVLGLVTAGAGLIHPAEPAPVKAGRVFQLPAEPLGASPYPRPRATENTVLLPDTFPSRCAVVLDAESGVILAEKNADTVISPASMTKVLTVLVAAEQITEADLDDTFTMTIEITDYCYVNGCSVVGLMVDETVSVRELFYGTILPSGADATLGLATYVSGSQEAFVELMNAKLEELGLSDTAHFTNCVGLYDEDHHCTVKDMAVILEAAMDNELCRQVLSAHTYETAPTEDHPDGQVLSNWFLRKIEDHDTDSAVRAVGAKTGYVVESGNCAASWGEDLDGHAYVCVTADAGSSWRAIFDHADLYRTYCGGTSDAGASPSAAGDGAVTPQAPEV